MDDGHQPNVARGFQPLVADIRDAVLNSPSIPANTKSAGENSGASDSERLDLYLKVICSSETRLVEPVHHYLNKSALLPPPLVELQKLADLTPNLAASTTTVEQVS